MECASFWVYFLLLFSLLSAAPQEIAVTQIIDLHHMIMIMKHDCEIGAQKK